MCEAHPIGGYFVLNRIQTTIAVGFLLGVTVMLGLAMFHNAIFWGELANNFEGLRQMGEGAKGG
jgi:hypothetical protein